MRLACPNGVVSADKCDRLTILRMIHYSHLEP